MSDLKVGDKVIFVRTIWQGRQGTITQLREADGKYGSRIRVNIPGTTCKALHEYSASAVIKIEEQK